MKPTVPIAFFNWKYEGRDFAVAYQTFGGGPNVLFLPAMSTVSTRTEWDAVATRLADQSTITLVDWPGFGASSRPSANYSPILYETFLRDFVRSVFGELVAVLATGHAAGYVLRTAASKIALWSRAMLVAPTWRGPLPAVMGQHPKIYAALHGLVATPGLGHALYHINTPEWFLRFMYGRHVFVDSNWLTSQFLAEKQKVARLHGARFAATAFVTGALDPFTDRDKCIEALKAASFPVLLVIGAGTPPKSRAEMEKLAGVCARPALILPGSLGLHEECSHAIIAPVHEFLAMKSADTTTKPPIGLPLGGEP